MLRVAKQSISSHSRENARSTVAEKCLNFRAYSGPAKQGTKKKTAKRTIKDMPGYKKKMEKRVERVNTEFQDPRFIKLFGPDSNYPVPPPDPKPKGPYDALFPGEEDIPKESEILMAELDREFERLKGKAAIVLQDPDYIIYDSLMQWRIQELELQWLHSPGAPTKESNAELKKKIDEVIFETDHEFDAYFAERPGMTKLQQRKMRQFFLNEMGGRIHFFPQDKWKLQLLDPKYDLEKHPLSLKERIKLFKLPTAKLASQPGLLYQQYRELAMHVDPGAKQVALPAERILSHFEMREHKKKLKEMDEKDLQAELEDMEFEKDMLLNASEDSRADEGDYSPDGYL